MKRFSSVVAFACNSENEKLVSMAEDVAKHKVNEMTETKKYSVIEMSQSGSPLDLSSKYKQLDEMFVEQIKSRSGISVEDTYGDIGAYASTPTVVSMATVTQKVILDSMLPIFINATGLPMLAEMHYVEYGQPLEFTLKDNSLYTVSEMSRRSKHTKRQEKKERKITLTPSMYGLDTFTTLPKVLQGIDSVAEDTALMAMSVAKKIFTLVLKEFKTKTDAFTDATWVLGNYTEATLLSKVKNLDAYNGGKAVIVGDAVALKSILPDHASTRILLSDEFNTTLGYMSTWNGYPVVAFDRVRDDDEATGFLGLDEGKVYAITMGSKLIQVGIGYTYVVTDDIRANYDLSADNTLAKEIAVQLITRGKVVKCTL